MKKKNQNLPVKLNGKKYFLLEFQLSIFLKGKSLWGHIDGASTKPTNNETVKLVLWEIVTKK